MRKIIYFVAIIALYITACSKEKLYEQLANNGGVLKNNDYITTAPSPIIELIMNQADSIDTKFNLVLYELAGGMLNAVKDSSLVSIINSNTDASTFEIPFAELIRLNSQFKVEIETFLRRNHSQLTYEGVANKLRYLSDEYLPVLYIPNYKTCNFSLSPIIAIGTDIYSTNILYEDFIPGWTFNSNGTTNEVIIGQEANIRVANPIIIVTANIVSATLPYNSSASSTSFNYIYNPKFTKFQIMNRYENSPHSEYQCGQEFIMCDGTLLNQGGRCSENFRIKDIHKRDIGKIFDNESVNIKRIGIPAGNILCFSIASFFVTYEYDWYAALKDVIVQNPSSGHQVTQATVRCRMKYGHEWYQRGYQSNAGNSLPSFVESADKEGVIKIQHYL